MLTITYRRVVIEPAFVDQSQVHRVAYEAMADGHGVWCRGRSRAEAVGIALFGAMPLGHELPGGLAVRETAAVREREG